MKIYPDFYEQFQCKAGRCRHTCCKGWEIDVDEETAQFYRHIEGRFGERLKNALAEDEDGWHFVLQENDRCSFLREDGLCSIILELGEDALCDICALHPRFYEEIEDMVFCGLGASCECVSELLLSARGQLCFVDESGECYDLDALLKMIGIPGCRPYRYNRLKQDETKKLIATLLQTEPIDDVWTKELERLKRDAHHYCEKSRELFGNKHEMLQRIYQYIFYRQMEQIPAWEAERISDYARMCTDFIVFHAGMTEDLAESLRRFSEQIEYSTVNVDVLLEAVDSS